MWGAGCRSKRASQTCARLCMLSRGILWPILPWLETGWHHSVWPRGFVRLHDQGQGVPVILLFRSVCDIKHILCWGPGAEAKSLGIQPPTQPSQPSVVLSVRGQLQAHASISTPTRACWLEPPRGQATVREGLLALCRVMCRLACRIARAHPCACAPRRASRTRTPACASSPQRRGGGRRRRLCLNAGALSAAVLPCCAPGRCACSATSGGGWGPCVKEAGEASKGPDLDRVL